MANIRNTNKHNPRLRINMEEYWDFTICLDAVSSQAEYGMCDGGLISYIDFSDPSCFEGDKWVYSKSDYVWDDAYTIDNTLSNIGYTGIDNGLILYRKDRITNKDFFEIFQHSKYDIQGGDNRLKLHAVSGTTLLYDYPLHVENDYVKLNGGFYQGFYMTECNKYKVLPNSLGIGETWGLEFQLKKCDLEKESNKTLNDKYPENKGIFFYMGTRAENKWIYLYDYEENKCFTLDIADYVEGAEIDKEEYIINNFFDLDLEVQEDYINLDDYTDYTYDDDYPIDGRAESDCPASEDYFPVDFVPYQPKVSGVVGWCCGNGDEQHYHLECKRKQCGCPKICKKILDPVNNDQGISGCDIFGEEYIDGLDALECETDYLEPELDISHFEYETDNGFKLSSPNDYYFYTDNKYLLFDRTKDGYTVNNWVEGTEMMYYGKKNKFKGNLFILMNRTKTGYTVNTIQDLIDEANSKYDSLYTDLFRNAFALRITDKGEIGYRYLIYDCDEAKEKFGYEYTIKEGYSEEGIIPDCEWTTIYVKIEGHGNTMKLLFYVNGKLVYITEDLPKFNFKELDDLYEKQEGVPFNISLGGGTQGLAETIIRNYMLNPTRVYPLEKHFAGSFIGYMKSFKFYNEALDYACIKLNAKN